MNIKILSRNNSILYKYSKIKKKNKTLLFIPLCKYLTKKKSEA